MLDRKITYRNVTIERLGITDNTFALIASNNGWTEAHMLITILDGFWYIVADFREEHPEDGTTILARAEMDRNDYLDKGGNALDVVSSQLASALFTDRRFSEFDRADMFELLNALYSYLKKYRLDARFC